MATAVRVLEVPDQVLLERIARRDHDALMTLYRRYQSRVFSLILRILPDRAQAEEVLQDVFYRLWERPDAYSAGKGQLIAWLLTVARNLALDRRRSEMRRGAATLAPAEWADALGTSENPELQRAVQQALAALPANQREALELSYFEGLTNTELAQRTGESLGTVKTRIRLGISKIREALRPHSEVVAR